MDEEIIKIVEVLRKGGVILYPTDTIWGLGCDATNGVAAEKIFKIKGRKHDKALIILVDSFEMLKNYVVDVQDIAIDFMNGFSSPLTVIFPQGKGLPKNVLAADKSVAARIPKDDFILKIIKAFGKPITSTSANLTGYSSPLSFSHVTPNVVKGVDYIAETNRNRFNKPKSSTIVRIDKFGEINIVRN